MKITRNRHLHILSALLNADGPLTSSELANRSDSSIRTVKQDIQELNLALIKDGSARILSRKSLGYQLEVLNAEKYQTLYTNISVMQLLYQKTSIESMNRSLYILKRFLSARSVNMEELADFFFLSKASFRDDFKVAVRFLASYDITVENVGKQIYRISGAEQDIRQAMVEVHASQYHDFETLYTYEPFNEEFYHERREYDDLRHAMLKMVRESRITLSDIGSKKIATLLCLSLKRRKKGLHPLIDPAMAEKIRETYDYSLAKDIFRMALGDESAEESEILNLARMMLCFRDFDLRSGESPELPEYLLRQNAVLYGTVRKYMASEVARDLFSTDMFYIFDKSFESMQLQIYLTHFFDSTKRHRIVTYVEQEEYLTSPMALELTRINMLQLEALLQEEIHDGTILGYASIYEELLRRVSLKYNRMRLAITSVQGLPYAYQARQRLLEHFSAYIRSMEVHNLYEFRRYDFSQFDCIIMTGLTLYYVYPIKLVRYRPLELENNTIRMFREVFAEGFDRSYLEKIKQMTRLHKEVNITSAESFMEALSYRYGKDDQSQQALLKLFMEKERILSQLVSRTGVLLAFLSYRYTDREFIDVISPAKAISYGGFQKINAIICVCIRDDTDLADKKALDSILQYLIYDNETMEGILTDSSKTYDEIFQQVILDSYLS